MKLRPPKGLRAHFVEIDGERFAVLDYAVTPPATPPGLTPAETAVFELLVAGASNAEIARQRGRSLRTIANQVASIFAKAGVGSRAELIARWVSVARSQGNKNP